MKKRSTSPQPTAAAAGAFRLSRPQWLAVLLGLALVGLAANVYSRSVRSSFPLASISVSELYLAMQKHPNDARYPIELARRCLMEQRSLNASRFLNRALDLQPDSAELYYLSGLCAVMAEKPEIAIEQFEHALKLQPRHSASMLQLGMKYVERHELKKAESLLKEYVHQEPLDPSGCYWLGVAAFTSGHEKTGLWALQRAVEFEPKASVYHLVLGSYYLMCKDSDRLLDKARTELERAAQLDPTEWMVHFRLAAVYLRRDHVAEAAEELERAVKLNPRAREPYFLLPQVYSRLGNKEKAEQYRIRAESLARSRDLTPGKVSDVPASPGTGSERRP